MYKCKHCSFETDNLSKLCNHVKYQHIRPSKTAEEIIAYSKAISDGIKNSDLTKNRIHKKPRVTIFVPCLNCNTVKEYVRTIDKQDVPKYCCCGCASKHTGKDRAKYKDEARQCKTCRGIFKTTYKEQKYCSYDCRVTNNNYAKEIYRRRALNNSFGGFRQGYVKGKKGWYKGIYCDSSWELAYIIHCQANGKSIERCKEIRKYIFEEKEHQYHPDFIVDGTIVEVKGYVNKAWEAKQAYNPDVYLIPREEMLNIIKEVELKHGKHFSDLLQDRTQ